MNIICHGHTDRVNLVKSEHLYIVCKTVRVKTDVAAHVHRS